MHQASLKTFFIVVFMTVCFAASLIGLTYLIPSFYKERKIVDARYMTPAAIEASLQCLTANIYHEAGNQSIDGKIAVAQVTLNRANSGKFPGDICKVVRQKSILGGKKVCQFSWYCNSRLRNKKLSGDLYHVSYAIAEQVFLEGREIESIKTALYFHADYLRPRWKLKKIAVIGDHIFYEG